MSNDNDNNGSDDTFAPVVGGLNSGGAIIERNGDPVRATSGAAHTGELVARTQDGFKITDPADLTPDSIVTLSNGMETLYSVALSEGLIKPPQGAPQRQQQDDGMSPQQQQQEQRQDDETQQQQEQPNPRLDDQSEAWLGESIQNSTEATVFAATDVINNDGELTTDAVENIAAANNIEPSEARARIAHVMAAMEREAAVESAKVAETSEAVAREALQAARVENPSAIREMAQRHFHSGRPEYGSIVRDYVATLDQRDPSAILNANPAEGRKVSWDAASRVVVVTDTKTGKTYTWASAVRLGLIGFTK